MKKIFSLLLCAMFGLGIFLTGCGTGLADLTNTEKEIIYNGGSVALVSDYLFYANGYAKDHTSMSDMKAYNDATGYASLNRIKKSDISTVTQYDYAEGKVENVSKNDLVGTSQTYMFAYGQHIYYVVPTTHKTSENKIAFDHLSVFRTGFNGTGRTELFYTENAFDTTNGKIVALEYDDTAYIMIYDGDNLVTIDITNGGVKANLKDVTSVAFPQEYAVWNGSLYFTKDADTSVDGNEVHRIDVDGTDETEITAAGQLLKTVKFTERIDNKIFFTMGEQGAEVSYTYTATANQINAGYFEASADKYYYGEISEVTKVCTDESMSQLRGYIFTANGVVIYHNEATDTVERLIDSTYESPKVITAIGEYVYFATTSGIYKISLSTKVVTEIVTGMTITTGVYGYTYQTLDGEKVSLDKIYFYAQRTYAEDTEDEDKTDENIYLHEVSAIGGAVKIVSQTQKIEESEE